MPARPTPKATEEVFRKGTVRDIAKLLQVEIHDLGQKLDDLKDRREVFSIQDGAGGELFPVFAFERNGGPQVSEAIPKVLETFEAKLSDLGIGAWFIAGNGYLDGECSKDLVEEYPNWVIAAALDEMNEVLHG